MMVDGKYHTELTFVLKFFDDHIALFENESTPSVIVTLQQAETNAQKATALKKAKTLLINGYNKQFIESIVQGLTRLCTKTTSENIVP